MKRNYNLYTASFVMRNVATGAFLAIFNLYMVETRLPETFLGLFLSVGNIAMCFSGVPIGMLCDRYPQYKKQFLILFTSGLSVCLFAEAAVLHEPLLLLISVLYGACFIGLANLNNVYLIELEAHGERNILVQNKGIGMAAYCAGTLFGGISAQLVPGAALESYRISLFIASGIAALSCAPLLLLTGPKEERLAEAGKMSAGEQAPLCAVFRRMLIPAAAFLCLGFAMLLNSYTNLYLKERFLLEPAWISVFLVVIQAGISLVVFAGAKYGLMRYYSSPAFLPVLFLIVCGCVKITFLPVNILLLLLLFGIYDTLIPGLMENTIRHIPYQYRNRSAGILNMLFNLSESLGIYVCSSLLPGADYPLIFLISFLGSALGVVGIWVAWCRGGKTPVR